MEIELEFIEIPLSAIAYINNKDYRILEVKNKKLIIESSDVLDSQVDLDIKLFNPLKYDYNEYSFANSKGKDIKSNEYSNTYEFEIDSNDEQLIEKFYNNLIELKKFANKDFSTVATYFDFYPKDKDREIHENYYQQMLEWYGFENKDYDEFVKIMQNVELVYSINSYNLYKQFNNNDFDKCISDNLETYNLKTHGIFAKKISRVYIGNEFCPSLFPNKELLFSLIEKAKLKGYKVSVVFPYIREFNLEFFENILQGLHEKTVSTEPIEIILNDFGFIDLVNKKFPNFIPVFGRLMNKRKKDPRINWKINLEKYRDEFEQNYLNCNHFGDYLKSINVNRFEFEDHLILNKISPGNHSLHFPFYQITTGTFCSLYAECKNFYDTSQSLVKNCPHYCEEFSQMYPKHLNTIGKGNTVFGFNDKIFKSPKHLSDYINKGINRIVYSQH